MRAIKRFFRFSVVGSLTVAVGCKPSAETLVSRCAANVKKADLDNAVLDCRKALQHQPRSAEALYWLGLAYFRQGKGSEAFESLRSALGVRPDDPRMREAFADVAIAALASAPTAVPSLYQAVSDTADWFLRKDPNSFHGHRLTGRLALLDKQPASAVTSLRKALTQRPDHQSTGLALSEALFALGDFQAGESVAKRLLDKDKRFSPAYNLLYSRYLAANRTLDAEAILIRKSEQVREPSALIELASHYSRTERPADRDAVIQRLLNLRTRINRYLAAGDFYAGLGEYDRALKLYEDGLRVQGADRLAHQRKALNTLLMQRREREALGLAERVVKDYPEDFDAKATLATLQFEQGQLDAAHKAFQELVQERPRDAVLRHNAGRLYIARKDWEAARSHLQAAAQARPHFVEPRMLLSEIALLQGKPDEALRLTQEAMAIQPANAKAQFLRILALSDGGDAGTARNELSSLISKYPKNEDLQLQMGLIALRQGRLAEAERTFRAIQQTAPSGDSRAVVGLSEALLLGKQSDQAMHLLERAVRENPRNTQLGIAYASLASRSGHHEVATRELERLHTQKPEAPIYLRMLAAAQRASGDLERATASLEKALSKDPTDVSTLENLAYTLYLNGDHSKSLQMYRKIQRLRPTDPNAINNLASLLAEHGTSDKDFEEALQLAQKAVRTAPSNPAYADTLGTVYLRNGLVDSALQIFTNLANRYPGNASFRHHLGLALLRKGDRTRAKAELARALNCKPTKQEEAQIRNALSGL